MTDPELQEQGSATPATEEQPARVPEQELVEEDLLVEDVSIDGMCGVY